jgi:hypothetical protein
MKCRTAEERYEFGRRFRVDMGAAGYRLANGRNIQHRNSFYNLNKLSHLTLHVVSLVDINNGWVYV